jgi:hypothetical protein
MEEQKPDPFTPLDGMVDTCDEFLSDFEARKEIVPIVQQKKEEALLIKESLTLTPPQLQAETYRAIGPMLDHEHRDLRETLSAGRIDPYFHLSLVTNTSSGTATMVSCVADWANNSDHCVSRRGTELINKWHQFQQRTDRPSQVRAAIASYRDNDALKRFDDAKTAFDLFNAGVGSRREVANLIRTLLYGVLDAIWRLARKSDKDRPKDKWARIPDLLAENDTDRSRLESQANVYRDLHDQASTVAKGFEGTRPRDINNIWAATLEHVFSVYTFLARKRGGTKETLGTFDMA